MENRTTNENMVNNSNEPQIEEFYKELKRNMVFLLEDVMKFDWVMDIGFNEEMFDKITDSKKYVIWEIENLQSSTDLLISYEKIIDDRLSEFEFDGDEPEQNIHEFIDKLIYEFEGGLGEYFKHGEIKSFEEVLYTDISNCLVCQRGNMVCEGYDYKSVIEDFMLIVYDRVEQFFNIKL